jgi:hypothetical protein
VKLRIVALAALALAVAAPAARATAVSSGQLRALAQRAAADPAALARLRAVDRVDGRPVDVRGALRGAHGGALAARLRVLAAAAPSGTRVDAGTQARDILSERRFTGSSVPGPFHGILDWLGDKLRRLGNKLDVAIPGPPWVAWVAAALVIGALATVISRRTLTGRVRAAAALRVSAAPPHDTARDLERRADAAEAAGDLATALRLRFRAGLLRLDARGAIEFRPSIPTSEVRRTLRSGDFDALAADFDDVIYGGRPPEPADVATSRERWPAVIDQAPRGRTPA